MIKNIMCCRILVLVASLRVIIRASIKDVRTKSRKIHPLSPLLAKCLGNSFICQGTSTRRQRSDIFGLRVKLPPVTTTPTTQMSALAQPLPPKNIRTDSSPLNCGRPHVKNPLVLKCPHWTIPLTANVFYGQPVT